MRYGSSSILQSRRRSTNIGTSGAQRKHRPDYVLVVLMGCLLVMGAMVVYAIGPGLTSGTDLPANYYSNKQLISIGLGIGAFIIASRIPVQRWKVLQPYIAVAAMIIALLVRFIGEEINGAHRWVQVGGLSFQAAELIKLAIVLWLAQYLVKQRLDQTLHMAKTFQTLGILAGIVVVVVAGLQSDLGSAAVMLAIIGIMAFVAGLPMKRLAIALVVVVLAATLAIAVTPYRRDRVKTFLNPTSDCQNEGYQACQALITIGSGGMFGKGLGRSVQAYGYLPEPANDSVFAIVAEKFGFAGSVSVLVIFWLLFKRIIKIAQSAPSDYARLLVVGVLVWISVQMMINVGAMVGLLPLKGITLPFISYGGTSIIFVLTAMGILFQISRFTELTSTSVEENSRIKTKTLPSWRRA